MVACVQVHLIDVGRDQLAVRNLVVVCLLSLIVALLSLVVGPFLTNHLLSITFFAVTLTFLVRFFVHLMPIGFPIVLVLLENIAFRLAVLVWTLVSALQVVGHIELG